MHIRRCWAKEPETVSTSTESRCALHAQDWYTFNVSNCCAAATLSDLSSLNLRKCLNRNVFQRMSRVFPHRGVHICFGGIAVSPWGRIDFSVMPISKAGNFRFDAFLGVWW